MYTCKPFAKENSLLHKADENSQKIEFNLFADSRCSHARAALALVRTANRFTDTRKSNDGRQKMHDCTGDIVIGVHVSRAKCKKSQLQFSADSPLSQAHATPALAETADRFTDTLKSNAGRRNLHGCTDDRVDAISRTLSYRKEDGILAPESTKRREKREERLKGGKERDEPSSDCC